MKIFSAEFQKIFARRNFIILFIAVLIINAFLNFRNECVNYPMPDSYQKLYSNLNVMPTDRQKAYLEKQQQKAQIFWLMKLNVNSADSSVQNESQKELMPECKNEFKSGNYLKYCSNIDDEKKLYDNVLNDYKRVNGYKNNLINNEKRFENKTQIAIFSDPGTFSFHNVKKTLADIKSVPVRNLPFAISQGVNMATGTHFIGTDILALLLLLFVTMKLITEEKTDGFFSLTHPMLNGQGKLGLAKISVTVLSSVIIVAALYLTNFILAGAMYGFGDLSRPIQSVSGFEGSFLNISVFTYLVIFAVTKICVFIAVALLLFTVCTLAKSPISVYLSFTVIFGIEGALYFIIDSNSFLGFFKYINFFTFMLTTPLYNEYYNVNLFSFAVNVIPLAVFFIAVLLIIFFYWGYSNFCDKKICAVSTKQNILSLLPHSNKIRGSVKILNHESFKIFVSSRGIFVIAALIAIQCISFYSAQQKDYFDSYYYKSYMEYLEGPVNQQKLDYIKSEKERFSGIEKKKTEIMQEAADGKISSKTAQSIQDELENQLKPKQALENVEKRAQYLQSTGKAKGKTLSFVYDEGYNRIFDKDGDDESYIDMLIMLIALIGCCAAVFSLEESSGLGLLIKSYCKGTGSTVRAKILISVLLAVPAFAVSFIPSLINTFIHYNTALFGSPAASLPMFEKLPSNISLLGCILILTAQRLLLAFCAVFVILLISQLSKNTVTSLIISTGVLISPVILHLMGVKIIDGFCLNSLASNMLLTQSNMAPMFITYAATLALSAVCILLTHNHYCRGSLRPASFIAISKKYWKIKN